MEETLAVVDADNRFVRWEGRRRVHEQRLVHRSIHIALFTSRGELVIQKRHRAKQTHASHWDISASGHVARADYPGGPDERLDAVYAAVAERELYEELGVRAALELVGRYGPEPDVHYEWIHFFRGVSDDPITVQESEVEQVRALELDAVARLIAGPELTTPSLKWLISKLG